MASPFSPDNIDKAVSANPDPDQSPVTTGMASPQPQTPGLDHRLMAGMLMGTIGDAASTNMSLGMGNRELNPLLPQSRAGNSLGIGLSGLGIALLVNKLAHSHPTLAKALAIGSMGISGIDTANNVRQMAATPAGGWKK